jgi:hypothetical protein
MERNRRIVKHEYHEGPNAGDRFAELARAVFQAPKVQNPKKKPAKSIARKKHGSDKGWNGSSCSVPAMSE